MICRTLGVGGAAAAPAGQTDRGRKGKRSAMMAEPAPGAPPGLVAAVTGGAGRELAPASQRSRGDAPRRGRSLLALLGIIAIGGLCLWAFTGLFSFAFHIGELVAVALLAGWAGYKLGHYRGRRGH